MADHIPDQAHGLPVQFQTKPKAFLTESKAFPTKPKAPDQAQGVREHAQGDPDHVAGQLQGQARAAARHLPTLHRHLWMPPPPPSPPPLEDLPCPPPEEQHPEWPWIPENSIRGLLWELSDDPDGEAVRREVRVGARRRVLQRALGRRWPARVRAGPAPVPEMPRPALLQGEQWTPHSGGPRRVQPCAARRPRVEPAEPAGALPVRATFSNAAHRSRLRELHMAERDRQVSTEVK